MAMVGVTVGDRQVLWNDIPHATLLPELVNQMRPTDRPGLRVSSLTSCPYNTVRQERFDYYVPLEAAYRMLRGKAWDTLVEQTPVDGSLYQYRTSRFLNGLEVTGTPDIIRPDEATLLDVKSPSRGFSGMVYPSYVRQVNYYRWLTAPRLWDEHNIDIQGLSIVYLGPSSQVEAAIEPWSDAVIEADLQRRIDQYQNVSRIEGDPGTCGDPRCIYCGGRNLWVFDQVLELEE